MGQKKKKKKRPVVEEFSWDAPDDDEEEFSWDAPDEEVLPIHPDNTPKRENHRAEAETTKSHGQGKGKRALHVTIGYNTQGLNQSEMIMEIACMRDTIPTDWGPRRWSEYLHTVGNVPFYIVTQDVDRYYMLLYAAEFFRQNPEGRDLGLKMLRIKQHTYNQEEEEAKQTMDQTTWGGVPKTEEKTVRQQVMDEQKALIDRTRSEAVPAEAVLTQQGPDDAYLAKWIAAEKRASQPRESWEGKTDWEFEQMIKYCYGWIRDIGEVPKPYPMGTIDLFWQPMRPNEAPMDELTVIRRNFITYKIMKFWRKSLKADPTAKDVMQFNPVSYRVTLLAQKLTRWIEEYATNWQLDDDGARDEVILGKIRKLAMKYYKAHFPIAMEGGQPGPIGTLDPGYVDYVRLCRKYKLEEGTLLHEANL